MLKKAFQTTNFFGVSVRASSDLIRKAAAGVAKRSCGAVASLIMGASDSFAMTIQRSNQRKTSELIK